MKAPEERQLPDGEELLLAEEQEATIAEEDPRESSIERRSQALTDAPEGNSRGLWTPSHHPLGE
jgi:hypothetical protein